MVVLDTANVCIDLSEVYMKLSGEMYCGSSLEEMEMVSPANAADADLEWVRFCGLKKCLAQICEKPEIEKKWNQIVQHFKNRNPIPVHLMGEDFLCHYTHYEIESQFVLTASSRNIEFPSEISIINQNELFNQFWKICGQGGKWKRAVFG